MKEYDVWWEEVGGVYMSCVIAKTNRDARNAVNKMIIVREVKTEEVGVKDD